jgi:hypothetical protein
LDGIHREIILEACYENEQISIPKSPTNYIEERARVEISSVVEHFEIHSIMQILDSFAIYIFTMQTRVNLNFNLSLIDRNRTGKIGKSFFSLLALNLWRQKAKVVMKKIPIFSLCFFMPTISSGGNKLRQNISSNEKRSEIPNR